MQNKKKKKVIKKVKKRITPPKNQRLMSTVLLDMEGISKEYNETEINFSLYEKSLVNQKIKTEKLKKTDDFDGEQKLKIVKLTKKEKNNEKKMEEKNPSQNQKKSMKLFPLDDHHEITKSKKSIDTRPRASSYYDENGKSIDDEEDEEEEEEEIFTPKSKEKRKEFDEKKSMSSNRYDLCYSRNDSVLDESLTKSLNYDLQENKEKEFFKKLLAQKYEEHSSSESNTLRYLSKNWENTKVEKDYQVEETCVELLLIYLNRKRKELFSIFVEKHFKLNYFLVKKFDSQKKKRIKKKFDIKK